MSNLPRALVAPDDFKGTFTAPEVAAALARGLRDGGLEADELPVADGGNGSTAAVVAARGGEIRTATVSDAYGAPVEARWGLLPDATAVIEMAEPSGLWRVPEEQRTPENAWRATTRGTGELIAEAVRAGAQRVLVAVGGSATTDGGQGAVEALDAAGVEVPIQVMCDVRVMFEDCAKVFGPQKGADPAMVERLTARLNEQAEWMPKDPRGVPMTGAAGGLSGGLWAWRGASLEPGAAFVLDTVGFDERMRGAALVVTGEGSMDEQTLTGKAVAEVATRARQGGVACHVVVGRNKLDPMRARVLDLASVREATDLDELAEAGRRIAAEFLGGA